ncbi:hypothetical protein ACET3Z_016975 [Daucus carota]
MSNRISRAFHQPPAYFLFKKTEALLNKSRNLSPLRYSCLSRLISRHLKILRELEKELAGTERNGRRERQAVLREAREPENEPQPEPEREPSRG